MLGFSAFLTVAALAASLGFLIGGILRSGKISDLYRRLELSDEAAYDQAQMISELSDALRLVLFEMEADPEHQPKDESIRFARMALDQAGAPEGTTSSGVH